MVSIGPYTESYDMKHMYDFVDLRQTKPVSCSFNKNTLMGIIRSNPDFTIFSKIVQKAQFGAKLSQKQVDYTLFVPSDVELQKKYSKEFLDNIDICTAMQILSFSTMNRKIDQYLLQSSPVSIFPTLDRSNSLNVSTVSSVTKLPNCTTVIHWNHPADNGIIHVVDNLLIPIESTSHIS
jgi:uncharacterized surface protein with fasciclin (FAS1) repeats